MRKIGQRVRIQGGMREFVGRLGTIIDNTERDGATRLYRVRLDAPVEVPGVGTVDDDLWAGEHLEALRRTPDLRPTLERLGFQEHGGGDDFTHYQAEDGRVVYAHDDGRWEVFGPGVADDPRNAAATGTGARALASALRR